MQNSFYLKIITGFIFVILLITGYICAGRKPLWNDELYAQVRIIEKKSYLEIMAGKFPEGNNSPLFYLVQKLTCDVFGYQFPLKWTEEGFIEDYRSQIILRISSNLFMTIAVVSLFYFFANFATVWLGLYAFLLIFSSNEMWFYWAEARPYALWILLTTWQCLLFFIISINKQIPAYVWNLLIVTHILLALTTIMSSVSIVIISVLIWVIRDKNIKKFFGLTIIPLIICLIYYLQAPHYQWRVPYSFYQLISPCFLEDQKIVLVAYLTLLIFYFLGRNSNIRLYSNNQVKLQGLSFFLWFGLMLIAEYFMCEFFKARQPHNMEGFEIITRYFIFLIPVGVVLTTLSVNDLINATIQQRWLRTNIIIGLVGLLIIRIFKSDPLWMWFEYLTHHVKL